MDARALDLTRVWHSTGSLGDYTYRQLIIARASGPFLIDDMGRRYLDATAGLGPAILGYGEPRVIDAMTAQFAAVPAVALSLASHGPAITLAERLAHYTPAGLDTVLYTAGANGARWCRDLARYTHSLRGRGGCTKLIDLRGALADADLVAHSIRPALLERHWSFADRRAGRAMDAAQGLQYVRDFMGAQAPDTVAAVIIEPVYSDVVLPNRHEFLRGIRELCDETGAYLVFDESRVAPGRTGSMFATGLYEVRPDMLILGNGMTAGYAPFGAILIDREVFDVCRNTLGGGGIAADRFVRIDPAACAAALTVLDVIESDGLVDKAVEDGAYLRDGLRELANTAATGTPRGLGMLAAIDLVHPATGEAAPQTFVDAVLAEARLRGVLLHAVDSALTFAPSFVCSPADLDQVTETVAESIATAAAARTGAVT